MPRYQFVPSNLLLATATLLCASTGLVQADEDGLSASLVEQVESLVDADSERLQTIFKDIHQHPELGFMETRTAGIIANELDKLGFEVKTGIGKTGVVGILKNGEGPTVMFRADMDANAVEEETGLPYASKVRVKRQDGLEVPVAHLCGHDAHVTWMLSLAKTMSSLKDQWNGTLVLVGQPAEEPIEGAEAMVKDGLYTKHGVPEPEYFLAMHTAPLSTGKILAKGGLMMAGTEQFDVTFHGVGGHGSSPQFTKDPIVMAATAILQYQTVISRMLDPRETGVVTVGSVQAGTDNNVIPESAVLKLNLRFFNLDTRQKMLVGIRGINDGIAKANELSEEQYPEIVRKGFSPPLVNSEELVQRLSSSLGQTAVVDQENIISEFLATTGSEDAHLLVDGLDDVKIGFFGIGTADPRLVAKAREEGKPVPFANHNPNYQVDLKAIPYGSKVAAMLVLELMATK